MRSAFADILNEPVPERLLAARARRDAAAAEPQEAEIIVLNRAAKPRPALPVARAGAWRLAAAAALFGLVVGGAGGYFGAGTLTARRRRRSVGVAAATNDWLDNAAGYYKLVVSAGDNALVDVPATGDPSEALQKISQNLPQQVRLPEPEAVGPELPRRPARRRRGRPAAQLIYTTDNKAIGPLTLIIGSSKQPDIAPTFDRRQDVNLLYWRHQGRAYVLVGQTDIGYLWGIANDVAWQLDAI